MELQRLLTALLAICLPSMGHAAPRASRSHRHSVARASALELNELRSPSEGKQQLQLSLKFGPPYQWQKASLNQDMVRRIFPFGRAALSCPSEGAKDYEGHNKPSHIPMTTSKYGDLSENWDDDDDDSDNEDCNNDKNDSNDSSCSNNNKNCGSIPTHNHDRFQQGDRQGGTFFKSHSSNQYGNDNNEDNNNDNNDNNQECNDFNDRSQCLVRKICSNVKGMSNDLQTLKANLPQMRVNFHKSNPSDGRDNNSSNRNGNSNGNNNGNSNSNSNGNGNGNGNSNSNNNGDSNGSNNGNNNNGNNNGNNNSNNNGNNNSNNNGNSNQSGNGNNSGNSNHNGNNNNNNNHNNNNHNNNNNNHNNNNNNNHNNNNHFPNGNNNNNYGNSNHNNNNNQNSNAHDKANKAIAQAKLYLDEVQSFPDLDRAQQQQQQQQQEEENPYENETRLVVPPLLQIFNHRSILPWGLVTPNSQHSYVHGLNDLRLSRAVQAAVAARTRQQQQLQQQHSDGSEQQQYVDQFRENLRRLVNNRDAIEQRVSGLLASSNQQSMPAS